MQQSGSGLVHDALFYSSETEYVEGVGGFVRRGLDEGAAVLVAVPQERIELVRSGLGDPDGSIEYVDMRRQGKNPARILPFIQAFVDARPRSRVRFVGEPIWAGRSSAEIVEGHRHEALINEAFRGRSARILCPYDAAALDPRVVAAARTTHPTIVAEHRRRQCRDYRSPSEVYAAADAPLPEPAEAVELALGSRLGRFRRDVERYAAHHGLDGARAGRLVLAAHEAAVNTFAHGGRDGRARIWVDDAGVVCEIADSGRIVDPLVGRRAPHGDRTDARGLWLVNQLCDLVELRSGDAGTVVRMHMDRG